MKSIIHRAEDRGVAEHGWLHSNFSFSFAEYYNPEKMGYGRLRVINDDIIEPGEGFGTHPHNNMEIISVVLDGALEHKDSMGTGSVIRKDEVQVMSAGSGITHSEFNHSQNELVNLLQIWIFPKEKNIRPRYDQKKFPAEERRNQLKTVVSGSELPDTLYIHQDAQITLGNLDAGKELTYKIGYPGNGAYLFVINGSVNAAGINLNRRDAAGISDEDYFMIKAEKDSDFIIIEVPVK